MFDLRDTDVQNSQRVTKRIIDPHSISGSRERLGWFAQPFSLCGKSGDPGELQTRKRKGFEPHFIDNVSTR